MSPGKEIKDEAKSLTTETKLTPDGSLKRGFFLGRLA
jgi:hypothetical protein